MRPVARIAQSVEQGIENPRVLGSIPSPGTTYSENPAYGWVFAFLQPDSSSNCVRLFAAQRLTPSGPARHARCSTPAALVRVRAPLFKEPAHKAGFCFSTSGLFHRTPLYDPCPAALRLRGPTLFEPAGGPVGRIRHLCRHPAQPRVRRLMHIARRRCACVGLRTMKRLRKRRPSGKRNKERYYSAAVFPLPGSLNASP